MNADRSNIIVRIILIIHNILLITVTNVFVTFIPGDYKRAGIVDPAPFAGFVCRFAGHFHAACHVLQMILAQRHLHVGPGLLRQLLLQSFFFLQISFQPFPGYVEPKLPGDFGIDRDGLLRQRGNAGGDPAPYAFLFNPDIVPGLSVGALFLGIAGVFFTGADQRQLL